MFDDTMALIRHRRSVRTFNGEPLRKEDAEKLTAFASSVPNPYDLPIMWRLLDAKAEGLTSPVIVGTDAFMAGKMKKEPHAEEAFGYAFERVLLYAESLGMGSTWIGGTMNRAAFERAMGLEAGEVMPCVSPLGYPAEKMSLRETMMRKGVRADSRFDFATLFFSRSFQTILFPENAGVLREPLEMVRWAPSAVNKQPWRVVTEDGAAHFYEKRAKGYVGGDGWDLQKVDIGIALCHFVMGLEEKQIPVKVTVSDPGLPAPPDTFYIATCVFG